MATVLTLDCWVLIFFLQQRGQAERRGRMGRAETKDSFFSFALNLSGSGNPEYAIHRVVEPEIDHVES